VAILDDDDALNAGALATMAAAINDWPAAWDYPLLFFAHGNASVNVPFRVMTFEQYLSGAVTGDLLPVFQRERYLAENLSYPTTRLGAEHLLMWQVCLGWGIPTWNQCVGTVNNDASSRMTSVTRQLSRSADHAQLQEATIAQFGQVLQQRMPRELRNRHLAAAVYHLLSGQRRSAYRHTGYLFRHGQAAKAAALCLASLLPAAWLRWLFVNYRRLTAPHTYRAE
jgi:hypothetical protein